MELALGEEPGGDPGPGTAGHSTGGPGASTVLGRPRVSGPGLSFQCYCLENPRDGGAWWAAVYGVAQSTRVVSSAYLLLLLSHFSRVRLCATP